jgi:hypothetical protein
MPNLAGVLLVAVAALSALTGCSGENAGAGTAGTRTAMTETANTCGTSEPTNHPSSCGSTASVRIASEHDADLALVLTNQSYDDPTVSLTVKVDGTTLISEQFDVENQHNFVGCYIAAPPGRHVISVASDSGAELEKPFMLPAVQQRYGLIQYWNNSKKGPGRLDWTFSSKRFAFA